MSLPEKGLTRPKPNPKKKVRRTHNALASTLAETHLRHYFIYRWFVEIRDREGLVYVSNCAPPANQPPSRDEQLRVIAEDAAEIGLVQVGCSEYPTPHPGKGYSVAVAVLFACSEGQLDGLAPPERSEKLLGLAVELDKICRETFPC